MKLFKVAVATALLFPFLLSAQSSDYSYSDYGYEEKAPPKTAEEVFADDYYETYSINNSSYWFYEKYSDSYYYSTRGVIKNGEILLPMIFSYNYGGSYDDFVVLGLGDKYGVFSLSTEKWTIPLQYDNLYYLEDGLYAAQKDGMYGIIDARNKVISDFQWSYVSGIYEMSGYVTVQQGEYPDSKYGVFNVINQQLVIPCEYTTLTKIYYEDNFYAYNEDNKQNIVTLQNELLFDTWYDEVFPTEDGRGYYVVKLDGKTGIVDRQGKSIIPAIYKYISSYPYDDGSYLAKDANDKYGCVRLSGEVSLPFEYDNISGSGNSLVAERNGKFGIIKANSGSPYELIACEYDRIEESNEIYILEKDGKCGLLDKYGNTLVDMEYDGLDILYSDYYGTNTVFKAKKGDLYYLLGSNGRIITGEGFYNIDLVNNASYDYYSYSSPFSYFQVEDKKGKYGVIDKTGAEVLKPKYLEIGDELSNILIVKTKKGYGLYSLLNEEVVLKAEYDLILIKDSSFIGIMGNDYYNITYSGGEISTVKY